MIEVNKALNGSELEMGIGQSLELRLPENPTTGYRWQLNVFVNPILELEEDSFEASGEAYGATGVRRWVFRSVQEGIVHLEMDLRRSWEHQSAEAFKVTIRVKAR